MVLHPNKHGKFREIHLGSLLGEIGEKVEKAIVIGFSLEQNKGN